MHIENKRITVKSKNPNITTNNLLPTSYIYPEDEIYLDREILPNNYLKAGLWALNKPKDMLGLRKDGEHLSGWLDNLDTKYRLALVGRLGKNESGLLLATCDGLLINAINTPGKIMKRSRYICRPTARTVTQRHVKNLLNGIHMTSSGIYKKVKAEHLEIIRQTKKDTFVEWEIIMDVLEGGHKIGILNRFEQKEYILVNNYNSYSQRTSQMV